jgi:hypothetical protein
MIDDGVLCQARIQHLRPDGTDRCRRQATHEHKTHDTGRTLALCTQHRTALLHRERQGSSRDLLELWDARPL